MQRRQMTDNKLQYTPPRSIRLDTMHNAKGEVGCGSGSGDSEDCGSGNNPGSGCTGDGSSTSIYCISSGNVTSGMCSEGNTPDS
jgi:hypothetical protein